MRNTVSQSVHEAVEDSRSKSQILDVHPVATLIAGQHGITGKGARLVEQALMMVGARAGVIMKIGSAAPDVATDAISGNQPIWPQTLRRTTRTSENAVADGIAIVAAMRPCDGRASPMIGRSRASPPSCLAGHGTFLPRSILRLNPHKGLRESTGDPVVHPAHSEVPESAGRRPGERWSAEFAEATQ